MGEKFKTGYADYFDLEAQIWHLFVPCKKNDFGFLRQQKKTRKVYFWKFRYKLLEPIYLYVILRTILMASF